jgi:hypothetical protein
MNEDNNHNENLAETLDNDILSHISSQLLQDIDEDESSRREWLTNYEQALGLLGTVRHPRNTSITSGGAAIEGMSAYQDPLLNEACQRNRAAAMGELFPADGPVRVLNEGSNIKDPLAEALEDAVNEFLTVGAEEYYPDSDKLLFLVYLIGAGIKKGFHCPLRRRPVIEAVDPKDLIVSNQATSLDTASRITQRIIMSKSLVMRLQENGHYVDVPLSFSSDLDKNIVDRKGEQLQGVKKNMSMNPDNMDRMIYESYCELDIPGYEHKSRRTGKPSGLPLPYCVTIDKNSKRILRISRNWKQGDLQCNKRKVFVMYPCMPSVGLWPFGLSHLIGNMLVEITAMTRMCSDSGMYGNFPAWAHLDIGVEQDKVNFQIGPGESIKLRGDGNHSIQEMFMPIPTKPLDPAFFQLISSMKEDAKRLAGIADIQVGEGHQTAPVGTTLSLIEQSMIPETAIHRRLHRAQCEEFRILKDLLQEDPESLWAHRSTPPDNAELIIQALNDFDLVPCSDPNTSSHIVRMSKLDAVMNLIKSTDKLWDIRAATEGYLDNMKMGAAKAYMLSPEQIAQNQQQEASAAMSQGKPVGPNNQNALQVQQMKSHDAEQQRELDAVKIAQQAHDKDQELSLRVQMHKDDVAREAIIASRTNNRI